MYGSNLGHKSPRKHGVVQVFTYKELEVATDGFSETKVIGRGAYGVVYKGILADGTVAAIKMLHRQGKQGERAFRIEASDFINYVLFPLPFPLGLFTFVLERE